MRKSSAVSSLESDLRYLSENSSELSTTDSLLNETPYSTKEDTFPILENISPVEMDLRVVLAKKPKRSTETTSRVEKKSTNITSEPKFKTFNYDEDVNFISQFEQYQIILGKTSESLRFSAKYIMEEILDRCFETLEKKLASIPTEAKFKLDLSLILSEILEKVFEYTKEQIVAKRVRFSTHEVLPKCIKDASYTDGVPSKNLCRTKCEVETCRLTHTKKERRKKPETNNVNVSNIKEIPKERLIEICTKYSCTDYKNKMERMKEKQLKSISSTKYEEKACENVEDLSVGDSKSATTVVSDTDLSTEDVKIKKQKPFCGEKKCFKIFDKSNRNVCPVSSKLDAASITDIEGSSSEVPTGKEQMDKAKIKYLNVSKIKQKTKGGRSETVTEQKRIESELCRCTISQPLGATKNVKNVVSTESTHTYYDSTVESVCSGSNIPIAYENPYCSVKATRTAPKVLRVCCKGKFKRRFVNFIKEDAKKGRLDCRDYERELEDMKERHLKGSSATKCTDKACKSPIILSSCESKSTTTGYDSEDPQYDDSIKRKTKKIRVSNKRKCMRRVDNEKEKLCTIAKKYGDRCCKSDEETIHPTNLNIASNFNADVSTAEIHTKQKSKNRKRCSCSHSQLSEAPGDIKDVEGKLISTKTLDEKCNCYVKLVCTGSNIANTKRGCKCLMKPDSKVLDIRDTSKKRTKEDKIHLCVGETCEKAKVDKIAEKNKKKKRKIRSRISPELLEAPRDMKDDHGQLIRINSADQGCKCSVESVHTISNSLSADDVCKCSAKAAWTESEILDMKDFLRRTRKEKINICVGETCKMKDRKTRRLKICTDRTNKTATAITANNEVKTKRRKRKRVKVEPHEEKYSHERDTSSSTTDAKKTVNKNDLVEEIESSKQKHTTNNITVCSQDTCREVVDVKLRAGGGESRHSRKLYNERESVACNTSVESTEQEKNHLLPREEAVTCEDKNLHVEGDKCSNKTRIRRKTCTCTKKKITDDTDKLDRASQSQTTRKYKNSHHKFISESEPNMLFKCTRKSTVSRDGSICPSSEPNRFANKNISVEDQRPRHRPSKKHIFTCTPDTCPDIGDELGAGKDTARYCQTLPTLLNKCGKELCTLIDRIKPAVVDKRGKNRICRDKTCGTTSEEISGPQSFSSYEEARENIGSCIKEKVKIDVCRKNVCLETSEKSIDDKKVENRSRSEDSGLDKLTGSKKGACVCTRGEYQNFLEEVLEETTRDSRVSFSPIVMQKTVSDISLNESITRMSDLEHSIELTLKQIMRKILESGTDLISPSVETTQSMEHVPNSNGDDNNNQYFNRLTGILEKIENLGVFHVCHDRNLLPSNFPSDLNFVFTNEHRPQFEISIDQVVKFVVPLKEILAKMLNGALRLSEIEISIIERKKRRRHGCGKRTREIVVRILNYQLLFETEIFRRVSLAYGNLKMSL